MATTINGIDVGKVQAIRSQKSANIVPITFPGGDSNETETFDMLGVSRILTISSIIVGTTATVRASVEAIEELCNGFQDTSYVFSSEYFTSALSVKVNDVSVDWDVSGVGNRAEVSIQLIEGI